MNPSETGANLAAATFTPAIEVEPVVPERQPVLVAETLDHQREVEARRRMVARLKTPEFRAMAGVVDSVDEIAESVGDSVRRALVRRARQRGEAAGTTPAREQIDSQLTSEGYISDEAVEPGQTHRDLTPYLSGIARIERGQALVNEVIDRLVKRESDELKERIRDGETYVHELVIGSGPHAQIYTAERLFLDPEHPGLIVEGGSRVGGQFQPDAAVHELNTKVGPEKADPAENVAGRSGNKNSLGRGVVQEPDISYRAYGTNDKLATAVRVNLAMEARSLVDAELVELFPSPDRDQPGRYVAVLIDPTTGEDFRLTTDRIIVAGGLGRDKVEFGDPGSEEIIAQEHEKFLRGEVPQLMTLGQSHRVALQRLRRGELPFAGMSDVILIGAGDSGSTEAEHLLGYAGESGLTVRQDTNIHISWVGQSAANEQAFATSSRHRYGQIAADMPPGGISPDEYAHRIDPIDGRALSLERTADGKIAVVVGIYDRDESGQILTVDGIKQYKETRKLTGSHVVATTGFDMGLTDFLCRRAGSEMLFEPGEIGERLSEVLHTDQARVYFGTESQLDQLEVTGRDKNDRGIVVHYRLTGKDGRVQDGRLELDDQGQQADNFLNSLTQESIKAVELPPGSLRPEFVNDATGEQVALRYQGTHVYQIGPMAFLRRDVPASVPQWMERSPGVQSRLLRQNDPDRPQTGVAINKRVALWTTVPATRDFARIIAKSDSPPDHDLLNPVVVRERQVTTLPEASNTDGSRAVWQLQLDRNKVEAGIPIYSTKEDMLKLAVAEVAGRYKFPAGLAELSIQLQRSEDDQGNIVLNVSTDSGTSNESYQAVINEILLDQLVQSISSRFLGRTRSAQAKLVVPLKNGGVRLRNVRLEEL